MGGVLAAIPEMDRARRSAEIERQALALPEMRGPDAVLLFDAFGSEVETAGIVSALREAGVRVLLPHRESGGLEATVVGPDDPLVPTGYGPREPERKRPVDPAGIDVVIAPGLAFDRRGRRLGRGGGEFDRYLGRLGAGTTKIGLAFAEQIVPEVPAEPHDVPMDVVVTDREVIRPGR